MYGTRATDCRKAGRVRRWPGRIRDAGGSRTHSKLLCRQPPYRLAPAPSRSVSSPGVEPRATPRSGGRDLRRVACDPLHYRDFESRRLDLHQYRAVSGTAQRGRPPPISIEPRRQQQECKDLNPVGRLWRPLPLPGGHSCNRPPALRPGAIGASTTLARSRSSTLR